MGLKSTSQDIIFIILFSTFIIFFAVYFLGIMNPSSDAMANDNYGLNSTATALNGQINSFNNFANTTKNALEGSTPNTNPLVSLFLIFKGAFDIPFSFLATMSSGISVITSSLFKFAGGGTGGLLTIVASIILAIIIVRLVLEIIEAIRTGSAGR